MTCKHFGLEELVDRATYMKWGEHAWGLISPDLQFSLDGIWEFFFERDGHAVITANTWHHGGHFQYRGYRGPECKEGAPKSQHRMGMAVDCDIKGYTAAEARQIIKEHQDDERLTKIMRMEDDKSWVHIDLKELEKGQERIYLFKA